MKGFFFRLLIVDLEKGSFYYENLSPDILERTLGGKGLGLYLLTKFQPKGVDAYSPENPLIFCLGPVTGTRLYGSSRYGVYTKSPLTGILCESYSGGKAPAAMSRTGIDALVILGRAKTLKYLLITDAGVSFQDATSLSGKDCHTAERELRRIHGKKAGILVIGPAGERLIPFAIISNDLWRCAGRTGAGAVMGSKNLKAIVFLGRMKRVLAEESELVSFSSKLLKEMGSTPPVLAYKTLGTPMMVDLVNSVKAFPTGYWRHGYFEGYEKINAKAMRDRMRVRSRACYSCFMACGKLSEVKDGRHEGLIIEGPEYETIYAFGGLCMIGDITEIAYLNDLCDKLGLDTITTGNLCSLAIEASRLGRIDEKLDYGNPDQVAGIIRDIVDRRGVGEILALGIRRASRELGLEDIAIHVKGLEPAGYDPRYFKGMGISYAVSDRGACHLRTTFYKAELSGLSAPDELRNKIALLLDFENRLTIMDSLILCRFYRDLYGWEKLCEIVRISTSLSITKEELEAVATQITETARSYNLREGLSPRDDRLPDRFHLEPLPESGKVFEKSEFVSLLHEYYRAKGWVFDSTS